MLSQVQPIILFVNRKEKFFHDDLHIHNSANVSTAAWNEKAKEILYTPLEKPRRVF